MQACARVHIHTWSHVDCQPSATSLPKNVRSDVWLEGTSTTNVYVWKQTLYLYSKLQVQKTLQLSLHCECTEKWRAGLSSLRRMIPWQHSTNQLYVSCSEQAGRLKLHTSPVGLQYFFAPVPLSPGLLIIVECSQPSFGERNKKKTKSVHSVPSLLVTVGNMSRIKMFHH